jgi:hypothetical protein
VFCSHEPLVAAPRSYAALYEQTRSSLGSARSGVDCGAASSCLHVFPVSSLFHEELLSNEFSYSMDTA